MASKENQLRQAQIKLTVLKNKQQRLDEKLGQLMSLRVDYEKQEAAFQPSPDYTAARAEEIKAGQVHFF